MAVTAPTLISVSSLLLLAATAVLFSLPSGAAAISSREYDSMQRVLRSRGYNLVCNAMATSDLQYELLSFHTDASFTIFAPTDAALFALDMIQTASSYTDTLRLHVVPLRLALSDLRSLANATILPTLLSSSALRLSTADPIAVSGVDVVLPGVFYSRRLAVHGLAGIVSLTSAVSSPPSSKAVPLTTPPQSNLTDPNPAAANAATAHLDRTDLLAPAAAESRADLSGGSPSPSFDEIPVAAPGRVPRTLLTEISDEIPAEKCGASDEMTIDWFVAEEGIGLEQLSINQRTVQARV